MRNNDGLIRLGVLALPLAGLLALVGLYSTFKLGPGGILASGDNRAIVSTGYFLSVFLGNVLALTVLIFGVVALYAYLANSRQRALALGAMILSIVGIAPYHFPCRPSVRVFLDDARGAEDGFCSSALDGSSRIAPRPFMRGT